MLRHNDSHLVGYSGVDGFGQASMVAFPPRAAMPRIPLLNLSAPSNGRVAASPAPLPITMLAPGMVMSPTGPTPRTIVPGAMQMSPSSGGASGAGAWWDGLSTVGKVGVVGGGALLLLGIAYGLSKTSKSSNEAFRPNRSRRRVTRRMAKRRRSSKSPQTDISKFYAGDGCVKVLYPVGMRDDVQAILDKYPPKQADLATVTRELHRIGASFTPWADGQPGDDGLY